MEEDQVRESLSKLGIPMPMSMALMGFPHVMRSWMMSF